MQFGKQMPGVVGQGDLQGDVGKDHCCRAQAPSRSKGEDKCEKSCCPGQVEDCQEGDSECRCYLEDITSEVVLGMLGLGEQEQKCD